MDNVRFNISPCTAGEVSELIAKIDTGMYTVNGVTKASERSHYDRYGFLCEDCRVAVVYDTSAHILSITGRQDHAQKLLDLFAPVGKYVKRSTVPAQGTVPGKRDRSEASVSLEVPSGKRAKIFVPPERLQRQAEVVPVGTAFASARGAILYTDEIFPPQTAKKRPLPSYGEKPTATAFRSGISSEDMLSGRPIGSVKQPPERQEPIPKPISPSSESEQGSDNARVGLAINASAGRTQTSLVPRKASICFGSEDDAAEPVKPLPSEPPKRKRGRPPKNKEQAPAVPQKQTSVTPPVRPTPDVQPAQNAAASDQGAVQKKRRGRPPKNRQQEPAQKPELSEQKSEQKPEFKTGGYSIKNFPLDALAGALKRLKSFGKKVVTEPVENKDTPQEVRAFTVSDERGQKVILRYATKRMTLALQGKHSDLFGEVVSQVSHDSDYSSALENYVQKDKPQPAGADKSVQTSSKRVSDVQNKLKRRLPTAFDFLSEQSRIDFSYCIHDFAQTGLVLSDYSVLLVPAFRGLERFVFDLQTAENIKVKMIGQAFDKNDEGKYVLKSGYRQRIGSVIYGEVLVSLYTEYFSQRNFFAHSDNTDANVSRSIPERNRAVKIFDHIMDTVEYNAKKLKEIGFSINKNKQ